MLSMWEITQAEFNLDAEIGNFIQHRNKKYVINMVKALVRALHSLRSENSWKEMLFL
jgi:hypothetical protein